MTIEWVELTAAHLDVIKPKEQQNIEWVAENRVACLASDLAKAMLVDGHPVIIGGITSQWENRYYFWAMFDELFHVKHLRDVIRGMRVFLAGAPEGRIECTVNVKNSNILKLLKMLGFALEGRLRYYYSWGDDAFMCSYIKES